MNLIEYFNNRIKEYFTIWDIKLAQVAAFLFFIVIIKLIPEIITLDYWVYILGAAIAAIRPMYIKFIKK
ncbi:MAG: hypothetical protein K9N07_01920 [Candidatus Cloacimonetes bacterium]|nr:hypothetical protein [Candidatus Cloacimonadota bacterium]